MRENGINHEGASVSEQGWDRESRYPNNSDTETPVYWIFVHANRQFKCLTTISDHKKSTWEKVTPEEHTRWLHPNSPDASPDVPGNLHPPRDPAHSLRSRSQPERFWLFRRTGESVDRSSSKAGELLFRLIEKFKFYSLPFMMSIKARNRQHEAGVMLGKNLSYTVLRWLSFNTFSKDDRKANGHWNQFHYPRE